VARLTSKAELHCDYYLNHLTRLADSTQLELKIFKLLLHQTKIYRYGCRDSYLNVRFFRRILSPNLNAKNLHFMTTHIETDVLWLELENSI
jgi:hypothetical protein